METSAVTKSFVHLNVHSYYSFFDSTLSPRDIVHLAAEQGAGAVALTDTNSLSGAVEFYKAALDAGVKPLLGAEVRQPDAAPPGAPAVASAASTHSAAPADSVSTSLALRPGRADLRVVLLARNFAGYSAVSQLVTRRMLDDGFDLLTECRRLPPDVVALSDCPPVLEALARHPAAGAPDGLHVFGALMPSRHARRRNRAVFDCAARRGLPLVIAADVRIATPADAPLHDLLQAMRRLTTIHHLREDEHLDPAHHFQSEAAVWAFLRMRPAALSADAPAHVQGFCFSSDPADWIANTARIAALCDCRLPLGEWKFPRFDAAPADANTAATLRRLAEDGLLRRYGSPPPDAAVRRLDYELGVITRLQFADYFLLVHRIVAEAHRRGFPTLGRGSAANSIVSYALGITGVCPLRHNLYFERFLNPERSAPPDIDVDFAWNQRDEILRWCFEFFGEGRVALIATIATLRTRQAIRETARAMGISPREVDAFNRLHEIGYREEDTGRRAWDGTADRPDTDTDDDNSTQHSGGAVAAGGVDSVCAAVSLAHDEPWRTVLAHARRIAGFPHHFSIHCGGIVISPEPVASYVPLTRSAKGFVITQMDMYGVEDLGLVKIDLLGNRSLAVLGDAVAMCEANGRGGPEEGGDSGPEASKCYAAAEGDASAFQREAVRMKSPGTRRGTSVALAGVMGIVTTPGAPQPDHTATPRDPRSLRERINDLDAIAADPATRALIHAGETIGCFYIESPGMRALFERLRCRNFEEVVAASSIIRPGVAESGMMQQYIVRHQSRGGRATGPQQRHGPHAAAAAPPHPLMLRILPETYGVMVYQEDVLRVAHEVAGMALSEADLLRRAMSGKMRSRDAMAAIREKFLAGARARGLDESDIAEIWRQISSFAGYSFCKGHSAAFAVLSFQVAYLKAHHPAEFFAAVLTNGGGFYGAGAYLGEARRRGLRILPACVNASEKHYTGRTGGGPSGAAGWVRIGLETVKGLSATEVETIVAQRRHGGPYGSVADFIRRTGTGLEHCRALVKAGALDALRPPHAPPDAARLRPALMLEAELLCRTQPREGGLGFAGPETLAPLAASALTPLTLHDVCRHEAETLGFMLSAHPLDLVDIPRGTVTAAAIREHAGRRVRMAGWLIAAKLLATKTRRQPMKMLTLEDHTGTFEATLFPCIYERLAPRTLTCGPYLLTGRVDVSLGSPTLNVTEVEVLRACAFQKKEQPENLNPGFGFGFSR